MNFNAFDFDRSQSRLVLEHIGWNESRARQFRELAGSGLLPARIIRVDRGLSLAQADGDVLPCRIAFGETPPAVGDWVSVEAHASAGSHLITNIFPRTSLLERSGGEFGGQAIASNVDIVFIVHSADQLNVRRLERELAQVAASGASPRIILTKTDIATQLSAAIEEAMKIGQGSEVHAVSALLGDGVETVAAALGEGLLTGALIGPSGAGKSTLVNALQGREAQATFEVRASDLKGRHTTTSRQLFPLPAGGALIDTPGMREFGLTGGLDSVDAVFGDIASLAAACRFNDCGHSGEPGCAVAEAVHSGELDGDRLASYRKLEREQEAWRARNDPLARQEREQRWKSIARSTRQRKKFGGKWE